MNHEPSMQTVMPRKKKDEPAEVRDRAVRVYLTAEEHALLRQAAAKADVSYSRFAIRAIVDAARKELGSESPPKSKKS